MYSKNLLLTLLVFCPFFLFGSEPEHPVNASKKIEIVTLDSCDLPAPTNFKVVEIGPTWAKLAWTPTVPNVSYRIKTYRVNGNVLVSNIVVLPNQTPLVLVVGLQPGETYYATANAICPDGTDSKYKATTPEWDNIITDLVVFGVQPASGEGSCAINEFGEYCEFPIDGSLSIYKIRPTGGGGIERLFNVVRPQGQNKLRGITDANFYPYVFKIDDKIPNAQGVPGQKFQIFLGTTEIATFELFFHDNVGRMIWTKTTTGYQIVRLSPAPFAPPGQESDRDKEQLQQNGRTLVSPNPFNETLSIELDAAAEELGSIELFNLNGQKVISQVLESGQVQHELSTSWLSPGFYMLRVETDGKVQTFKVIKSE